MPQLTEVDDGRSISIGVGDEVVVRLAENPTTGYRWELGASGDDALERVDDSVEPGGAPGAGGQRVVRFIARRPGAVRLEAALRRGWEAGSPRQQRTFVIEVT